MFKSFVVATCALVLAACVQEPEEEISQSSVLKGSPSPCLAPVQATKPLPPIVQWTGVLPPQVSARVVWIIWPTDANGTEWVLEQVDVDKDYVVSRTKLAGSQRPEVLKQLGMSLAIIGGVRVGGPRPGPIGGPDDVLAMANALDRVL